MPTTTVWLDDDRNVVDRDRATYAVETETDDQGRLVRERWIRIPRPDSAFADEIAIHQKARDIATGKRGSSKWWIWAIALVLLAAAAIWLLVR
jgi:hypothetical protein